MIVKFFTLVWLRDIDKEIYNKRTDRQMDRQTDRWTGLKGGEGQAGELVAQNVD